MKDLLIYVSAPYRANTKAEVKRNIGKACLVGLAIIKGGSTPIVPHALTCMIYQGVDTRKLNRPITRFNNRLLHVCDVMFVVTERGVSKGMIIEIRYARRHGIRMVWIYNHEAVPVVLKALNDRKAQETRSS